MTAIIGLITAFAILVGSLFLGGTPGAYLNGIGLLFVVGGSIAVTVISFSLDDLLAVPGVIRRVIDAEDQDLSEAAEELLRLAESARKDGLVGLQKAMVRLDQDDPFLARGIQLVVDGAAPEVVEALMRREANTFTAMEARAIEVLRRLGEVAPAMGLIGTIIGLVRMLGSLDDVAAIGPAMAIALLTTFYGLILAQMVFLPLAAKAERYVGETRVMNDLYALGTASISRKENPRRLEILFNTILPAEQRVSYFK